MGPASQAGTQKFQSRLGNCLPEEVVRDFLGPEEQFSADRAKAFCAKQPYVFVCAPSPREDSQDLKLLNGSSYYNHVDLNMLPRKKRDVGVYYTSLFDEGLYALGSLECLDSDESPLAHHLLMVNDEIFLPGAFDRSEYNESVVASALLFEIGLYVQKNEKQAQHLFDLLDAKEKFIAIGGVFLEAIRDEQLDVALRCVDHGARIHSINNDGHVALFASLAPGLEDVLDRLLATATDKWNVQELVGILSPAATWGSRDRDYMSDESIRIVQKHIDRLSR